MKAFMHSVRPIAAMGVLSLVMALAGCSAVKTYPNELPKNMHVTAEIDSGSSTMSTVAEFDIHRVDAKCETLYDGRVYLDQAQTEVGIPTGEVLYLDFIFASKRFLSSTTYATRYTTLFRPRAGYEYLAKVKYVKGLYSVSIKEVGKNGATREIERVPLSSCKPAHS